MSGLRASVVAAIATLLATASSMSLGGAALPASRSPVILPPLVALKSGDVIFRNGISVESYAVRALDPGARYSHAGLVDLSPDGAFVVHIEPGATIDASRVRRERIEVFLGPARANAFAVYHVLPADAERSMRAIKAALEYLVGGVTFDREYDLETVGTMYCTELVWRAYLDAGVDLLDGQLPAASRLLRRPLLTTTALAASPHLVLADSKQRQD